MEAFENEATVTEVRKPVVCNGKGVFGCDPNCVHGAPHQIHPAYCECGDCGDDVACNMPVRCTETGETVTCEPYKKGEVA